MGHQLRRVATVRRQTRRATDQCSRFLSTTGVYYGDQRMSPGASSRVHGDRFELGGPSNRQTSYSTRRGLITRDSVAVSGVASVSTAYRRIQTRSAWCDGHAFAHHYFAKDSLADGLPVPSVCSSTAMWPRSRPLRQASLGSRLRTSRRSADGPLPPAVSDAAGDCRLPRRRDRPHRRPHHQEAPHDRTTWTSRFRSYIARAHSQQYIWPTIPLKRQMLEWLPSGTASIEHSLPTSTVWRRNDGHQPTRRCTTARWVLTGDLERSRDHRDFVGHS
jgi:hypothetical protein